MRARGARKQYGALHAVLGVLETKNGEGPLLVVTPDEAIGQFPRWVGFRSTEGHMTQHYFRIVSQRGPIVLSSKCGHVKSIGPEKLEEFPNAPKCGVCLKVMSWDHPETPLTTWDQYYHTDKTKINGGPHVE